MKNNNINLRIIILIIIVLFLAIIAIMGIIKGDNEILVEPSSEYFSMDNVIIMEKIDAADYILPVEKSEVIYK